MSFRANSRRNIEASVKLFIDLFGDLPVADIHHQHAAEYVGFLERIPATHGKSAKERRALRQVIEDADREKRVNRDRLGGQMRQDGRSPGEIEEAVAAARIERLRTNTCVRHMREFARIVDFAVLDGLRQDNPMRERMWTAREINRRTSRETEAQRVGWGDDIHALLASPIYRQPLPEPGEPLFWAPLLGMFAGLRMEEAQQGFPDFLVHRLGPMSKGVKAHNGQHFVLPPEIADGSLLAPALRPHLLAEMRVGQPRRADRPDCRASALHHPTDRRPRGRPREAGPSHRHGPRQRRRDGRADAPRTRVRALHHRPADRGR